MTQPPALVGSGSRLFALAERASLVMWRNDIFWLRCGVEKRKQFRRLMARPEPLVVLGVYDCLSGLIAERAGYEAVIITGAGIAASVKGYPDFGLMTMPEVLAQSQSIIRSIGIPAIADCDTGYGNALNVRRTTQEFEAAGAACIFIEDQVAPWRCGQFDG